MNIKIFIACHKQMAFPSHPLLQPIQVGSALSEDTFPEMLQDNTGDNISEKNPFYCELTAQYWAWKNQDLDYYGFFHYRRFLSFNKINKHPYFLLDDISQGNYDLMGYNLDNSDKLIDKISQYDIIAPYPEEMYQSAYDYYATAPYQYIKDLDLIINIINEDFPQYALACKNYMVSTKLVFCNMYILQKKYFNEYCQFLFDVLAKYEKASDKTGYTKQEMRTEGFLAEWIFGIYFNYLSQNSEIKICMLQRADFLIGNKKKILTKIKYRLFPPSSRQRSYVRTLMRLS